MKKIIFILISIILIISLCGCCANEQNTISTWKKCGHIEREGEVGFIVYYDENTKVMYASNAYGKTVLLNSDGTPMLWEGGEG